MACFSALCILHETSLSWNLFIISVIQPPSSSRHFAFKEFNESFVSLCMAFDTLNSNHYKLIFLRRVRKTDNCQIHVYSSDTDCWSPLEITFTPPNDMQFSNGVFCNGAVHWYSLEETSLYFDVDRECLNTLPMPNLAHSVVRYFGESRGYLHLIVTEGSYPSQFDVLEMAADYSRWFVRYHVNVDVVKIVFPDLMWYIAGQFRYSVLHVIRAQEEEELIVVLCVGNKAISYNVHYGTSKKHCDLKLWAYYRWSDNFQYFESLAYFGK